MNSLSNYVRLPIPELVHIVKILLFHEKCVILCVSYTLSPMKNHATHAKTVILCFATCHMIYYFVGTEK